jgi:hypothetical protein
MHTTSATLPIRETIAAGLGMIEQPRWRSHQERAAVNGFYRFLDQKQPLLSNWPELMPGHIYEFVKWMENELELSPPTVNNYLNPVRKAAAYVQLYHPKEWQNLFVRRMKRAGAPKTRRYLMADQIARAIRTARDMNEPAVVGALWFCGFAGLGLTEFLQIEREDIRFDGTLWVRAEKNAYRPRLVPLCAHLARFADCWREIYSHAPLKTAEALSHKARAVLNVTADNTGDESYRLVDLHEATRPSFANIALHAGVDTKYLDAYMGHAPQGVFEKHYADLVPSIHDMPRLQKEKVLQMRKRVIEPIDKKLFGLSF